MCPLGCHLLHCCPRCAIIAGFHVAPLEARRGNLREDPACSGALRETALEDDLILYLSRDECSHEVAYRSDPGGAPCLDRWVEEAQGSAVFIGVRLAAQRAARGDPYVHDGSPFQDPAEVPLALELLFCPIRCDIGNVNVPGADELSEEHEVFGKVWMGATRLEGLYH